MLKEKREAEKGLENTNMSISLAKASGSAEMLSQHKVPPDSRVELCVLFFILPLKGSSFLLSLFLLSATLNPPGNRITDFITERGFDCPLGNDQSKQSQGLHFSGL